MKNRRWTYGEVNYLKDKWGDVSIKSIALKLHRSISSIKQKAQRLGLTRMTEWGDYITFNQLVQIINGNNRIGGMDYAKFKKAGFPCHYQTIISKKIRIVYMDEFWRWLKKNKNLIDLSNTSKRDFCCEPEWVEEKRKADKMAAKYKKTPWTKEEDARLLALLKEFKYGYREISIMLKRTEGAIKRRMCDLNIKLRPLRADNHTPWSADEIEKVKDLYLKGYKSSVIAEFIERSALAINGLLERHNYFKEVKC